jgi:hypothetical protein
MSQPAFPLHNHGAQTLGLHLSGMTLRDYFAAKAFQVRLAKYDDWTLTELSYQAYLDADALLEARSA